jgi:Rieske Fe-S protein
MNSDEHPAAEPGRESAEQAGIDRRGFLVWAAVASFGATVFFLFATLLQAFRPPSRSITGMTEVGDLTVARISDLQVGKPYLADYGDDQVFVVKLSDTRVTAFDAACPHARCTLVFSDTTGHFECPCHASAFTIGGRRLSGPAPRDMVRAVTDVVNGYVIVSGFRA